MNVLKGIVNRVKKRNAATRKSVMKKTVTKAGLAMACLVAIDTPSMYNMVM